jgi:hypothetical protein
VWARDARQQRSNHSAAKVERCASTQKPVTQGCGRVLGETIHFDKNTTPDRTSQLAFELLFHSSQHSWLVTSSGCA